MFKTILLPVDLTDQSSVARPLALAIQLARQDGATLHVITVVPDFGMSIVGGYFDADFEQRAMAEATRQLEAWAAEALPREITAETHVAHGRIYQQILHAADTLGCDAIVLGAHRPEFSDYLLGPNAARVVRHASQSVMVVRD